ncbi:MAG: hypothetical protein K6B74_00420 [Ruminococcus sp.]|nr:hypothetical protein [Ruminococcus sp.]
MNAKKKRVLTVLAVILAAVLLVPFPIHYKDGGTVDYRAVLYTVRKEHSIAGAPLEEEEGYYIGTRVRVLFWVVCDDVEFVPLGENDTVNK